MIATCGAGVTAAAGTGLAHHLFVELFTFDKSLSKDRHLGSPRHAFAHCEGSAAAAPLRARISVSVSFSGLELSFPLPIIDLVSHYLTNNLIGRRLILWRCLSGKEHSSTNSLSRLSLSFPRLSKTIRQITDVLLSSTPPIAELTCMP